MVLSRLALGRINRHLKRIAAMIDVKIPLTTYTARHTWATLARDCGAPVSVISAGLGHTSEEMTRIYLKEFDVSQLDKVNSIEVTEEKIDLCELRRTAPGELAGMRRTQGWVPDQYVFFAARFSAIPS